MPAADCLADRALLAFEPRQLLVVVDAHRPAHGDDRVERPPVRKRFSLVELDAPKGRSALTEHVLVDAGRLAGDVLEDEDVHRGNPTRARGEYRGHLGGKEVVMEEKEKEKDKAPKEPEAAGAESAESDAAESTESSIARVRRLAEEFGTSAVGSERMASTVDRLGQASRSLLNQLNIALEDEVEELRRRTAALEERVVALESMRPSKGGKNEKNDG